MSHYGLIKNYDSGKGTGTITPEKGGDALMFNKSGLANQKQDPKPTQRYAFETSEVDGGKKQAVNMRREGGDKSEQHKS